jgi:hypothetical protein
MHDVEELEEEKITRGRRRRSGYDATREIDARVRG